MTCGAVKKPLAMGVWRFGRSAPAAGSFLYSPAEDDASALGQFDLAPWQGPPPGIRALAQPVDASQHVKAVQSGRLTLRISARWRTSGGLYRTRGNDQFWARLQKYCNVALVVGCWSAWPGNFGAARFRDGDRTVGAGYPSFYQARFGPELIGRLVTTGCAEIDVSAWAAGARYVALFLHGWQHTFDFATPFDLELDWQLVDGAPVAGHAESAWPVSRPVYSCLAADFPAPHGAGPADSPDAWLVGQVGMTLGQAPRVVGLQNPSAETITAMVEVRYGAAGVFLAPVTVGPGEAAQIANLVGTDCATGLLVYAHSNGAVTSPQFTLSFLG